MAGVGALAAFTAAAVVFGDPIAGASTPAEAADAIAGSQAPLAAVLLGAYALLAIVVVGRSPRDWRQAGTPAPSGCSRCSAPGTCCC
jgi:hypothetical protein